MDAASVIWERFKKTKTEMLRRNGPRHAVLRKEESVMGRIYEIGIGFKSGMTT